MHVKSRAKRNGYAFPGDGITARISEFSQVWSGRVAHGSVCHRSGVDNNGLAIRLTRLQPSDRKC